MIQTARIVGDRYHLVRRIGEGRSAQVFEGVRLDDDFRLAVKVFREIQSADRQLKVYSRYERQIGLLKNLEHPNLVNVFDFGMSERGNLFFAAELLEGQSLGAALAERGRFEVSRAIRLMVACLDGLHCAHRNGIVHRALKPANLFLDTNGSTELLRISDFGATLVDEDVADGAPQYLPPEYITDRIVSAAMDVYQMGLVLVEMCTGDVLVNHANSYHCLMAHCRGELDIPPEFKRSDLGPILAGALERDHRHRYQNAAEFREALLAVDLAGEPTSRAAVATSSGGDWGNVDPRDIAAAIVDASTASSKTEDGAHEGVSAERLQDARHHSQEAFGRPDDVGPEDATESKIRPVRRPAPSASRSVRGNIPAASESRPAREGAPPPSPSRPVRGGSPQGSQSPPYQATGSPPNRGPSGETRSVRSAPPSRESRSVHSAPPPSESRSAHSAPPPSESRSAHGAPPPRESRSVHSAPPPRESRSVRTPPPPADSRAGRRAPPPMGSRSVLRSRSDDTPQNLFRVATEMLTARNNVEALEYFRYALKGQPGNHEYMAHVLWAERLTNHSSPEECRRQLLALSVIDDKHARMWAWTMLGRLARVEGNEEACNEAYRKVLVTDSTNHEATRELRLRERRSSEDKSDGLLGKFFK